MIAYIDQTDRMFDFLVAAAQNEKAVEGMLVRYDQNAVGRKRFARFQEEMVQRAAALFKRVGTMAQTSVNLRFALIAMGLHMQKFIATATALSEEMK
jgi:hypothetical protein